MLKNEAREFASLGPYYDLDFQTLQPVRR